MQHEWCLETVLTLFVVFLAAWLLLFLNTTDMLAA